MHPSKGRCQIWFWEVGGLLGGGGPSKRQAVARTCLSFGHVDAVLKPQLWVRAGGGQKGVKDRTMGLIPFLAW